MNILIVDDEEHPRRILKKSVPWKSLGIKKVFTAASGVEALKILEIETVDIILSDIKMPKMTGLELAANVNRFFPDIRFLLLSNYGEKDYMKQAIKLNVSSFIEKPIDIEEITHELEIIISKLKGPYKSKDYREMFMALEDTIKEKDRQKTIFVMEKIHDHYSKDLKILGDVSQTLAEYKEKYFHTALKETPLKIITDYIEQNYDNPELTIILIAKKTGYSPNYLCRIFKKYSGLTINRFIFELRLIKAKSLLTETELGIYRVGNMVGYNNGKYFVKLFERETGMHPGEFRKQARNG